MSDKTKTRTHQSHIIAVEDFDKYAVIPKDQLDIINQYVSILDRQLGLLQRVLNVNGLHDSYVLKIILYRTIEHSIKLKHQFFLFIYTWVGLG